MNPLKFLDGYKTYIGLVVWAVAGALGKAGILSPEVVAITIDLALGWTGLAITHKASKALKK